MCYFLLNLFNSNLAFGLRYLIKVTSVLEKLGAALDSVEILGVTDKTVI